jgi:hypothetical protein
MDHPPEEDRFSERSIDQRERRFVLAAAVGFRVFAGASLISRQPLDLGFLQVQNPSITARVRSHGGERCMTRRLHRP